MAARAKPAGKPGGGRSKKDQINGLDPEEVRQFFDSVHEKLDGLEETSATVKGAINRIYEKACDKLDVSKDALTFLFKEERAQRKKAQKAAKLDSRARDSLERLGNAMPDGSPMAIWAKNMVSVAAISEVSE